MINQFKNAYIKAPCFKTNLPLIEEIINYNENNLFKYIYNSVKLICDYLDINTEIVISSSLNINHELKSEKKVLEICKKLNTNIYINAIGGMELYDKNKFKTEGIDLNFIKSNLIEYKQFNNTFIAWLSILDVLMFNSKEKIKEFLNNYELI